MPAPAAGTTRSASGSRTRDRQKIKEPKDQRTKKAALPQLVLRFFGSLVLARFGPAYVGIPPRSALPTLGDHWRRACRPAERVRRGGHADQRPSVPVLHGPRGGNAASHRDLRL